MTELTVKKTLDELFTGKDLPYLFLGRYDKDVFPADVNTNTGKVDMFSGMNYLLSYGEKTIIATVPTTMDKPVAYAKITGIQFYDVQNKTLPGVGFTFSPDLEGMNTRKPGIVWEIKRGSGLDLAIQTQLVPNLHCPKKGSTGAVFDLTTLLTPNDSSNAGKNPTLPGELWTCDSDMATYNLISPLGAMRDLMAIPVTAIRRNQEVYGVLYIGPRVRSFANGVAHTFDLPYASAIKMNDIDVIEISKNPTIVPSELQYIVSQDFWEQGGDYRDKSVFIFGNNNQDVTADALASYVTEKGAIPIVVTPFGQPCGTNDYRSGKRINLFDVTNENRIVPSQNLLEMIGRA